MQNTFCLKYVNGSRWSSLLLGGWLCHTSTGLGYSCSGSRVEAAEYPGVHGESLQSVEEEEEEELLFY